MIFGLVQIAFAVALLVTAPRLGGPAWLMLWPGSSVFVVGLGYLGIGARVFGKRVSDGRLAPWPAHGRHSVARAFREELGGHLWGLLVLPYSASAWLLWQLRSRLFREPPYHEVAPGLYVGRRPLGRPEVPPGIRVVVDLTSELPRSSALTSVERYLCVPTLDTKAPRHAELHALVDAIAGEPGPIFLHCAMGHGRAAMVAAALLIRRGLARDVDEALEQLRSHRPSVHLHRCQRAAVERVIEASPAVPRATYTESR